MNRGKKPHVVALIPAYNEEAAIAKVILQTQRYVSKVIVCDDGSTDMTNKIARSLGVTVLKHQKNLGKGAALRTLFVKARRMDPDIVVMLDADGQHDPSQIPNLIKAMQTSQADIVVGSRFVNGRDTNGNVPKYRVLGNKVLSMLTDMHMTDTQSGFRAYSKTVLNSLSPTVKGMGVDSEMLMKAKEINLKIIETPIKVSYDVSSPSKHNFIFHAAQVILSVVKQFSIQRAFLFYGIPGLAALVIASGLWIWAIRVLSTARQILFSVAAGAIAATVLGLILFVVSITVWLFSRGMRKGSKKIKPQ